MTREKNVATTAERNARHALPDPHRKGSELEQLVKLVKATAGFERVMTNLRNKTEKLIS